MKQLSLPTVFVLIASQLFFLKSVTAQTGSVGIGTISPQSQLHTTGSVRHDTLAGLGRRLVFTDAVGRLSSAAGPGAPSSTTPTAIPNANCFGVTSNIVVTGMPTAVPAGNIKVRVDISHTAVGELDIFLIAPGGGTLNLAHGNGGTGNNFTNTIFWDGATQNISTASAPFNGTYNPSGSSGSFCSGVTSTASSFGGLGGGAIVPNGIWALRIFDATSGSNVGTLNNWSISFDGSDPQLPASAFANNRVPKATGGTLIDGSIYDVGGNVGIGTSTPVQALHIVRGDYGAYNGVRVEDNEGVNPTILTITPGYSGVLPEIGAVTLDVPNTGKLVIGDHLVPDGDGSLTLGMPGRRWGALFCTNGTIQTSDMRQKKDVKPLQYGLKQILSLRPITFNWKDNSNAQRKVGFSAQEIQALMPELVSVGDDSVKTLGVNYGEVVPVLVRAIQEQQALITALQKDNEWVRRQAAAQRTANAALQTSVAELRGQMQRVLQAVSPSGTARR